MRLSQRWDSNAKNKNESGSPLLAISETTNKPFLFNDRNKEEIDRYVPKSTCDFFVESYSRRELLKIQNSAIFCRPIVDLEHSKQPFRSLFLLPINSLMPFIPLSVVHKFLTLRYYCLVRNVEEEVSIIEGGGTGGGSEDLTKIIGGLEVGVGGGK